MAAFLLTCLSKPIRARASLPLLAELLLHHDLYFVSNRGGTMDLWQQHLGSAGTSTGSPERLTTGIGMMEAFFSSDSLSQNH